MKTKLLVECLDLTKNFSGKKALDAVNLQIGRGKIIGLLGPNGSGKTTLIKILNGLLEPTFGSVLIDGEKPGPYTKSIVSYLPDRTYFADWMKVRDIFDMFCDFYKDFDRSKAEEMCGLLNIGTEEKIKNMSKGTKEKVQLIMVMSRAAKLYLLDEPIGGVDPAARDYILNTIINNYDPSATVLISTHLISDVERVLDEFLFLYQGRVIQKGEADAVREETGKSLDELFREVFKCLPNC